MDALRWWLIPLVATLLAIAVVSWRGRTRPPVDPDEAMADFARFRAAMERPLPARTRRTRPSSPARTGADPLDGLDRPA